MAASALRRRKKEQQNERWARMSPSERMRQAAAMTAAARSLRAAGLAQLGFTPAEIRRIERLPSR